MRGDKHSEAMHLSPQSRVNQPLLAASSGTNRTTTAATTRKQPSKLKNLRMAMKSMKPTRKQLTDDDDDSDPGGQRITVPCLESPSKVNDLSFSDLRPKEIEDMREDVQGCPPPSGLPLRQPSMNMKAFRDVLEQQGSLTEADLQEGNELSFSDLRPTQLVVDEEAAANKSLRASGPLREPSLASTQLREMIGEAEVLQMDDEIYVVEELEGSSAVQPSSDPNVISPSPAAPAPATNHRAAMGHADQDQHQSAPLEESFFEQEPPPSLVQLSVGTIQEPQTPQEEEQPNTCEVISKVGDLDHEQHQGREHHQPKRSNTEPGKRKKASSRAKSMTLSRHSQLRKSLPSRSKTAENAKEAMNSIVTSVERAAPCGLTSATTDTAVIETSNSAVMDEPTGSPAVANTEDGVAKKPSKGSPTREKTGHSRSNRRSRSKDTSMRTSRSTKDTSMNASIRTGRSYHASSSHLPRRSRSSRASMRGSSKEEDRSDRKRRSRRTSSTDGARPGTKQDGSSKEWTTVRPSSRDASVPPPRSRSRSKDKPVRTRSRDSSMSPQTRCKDGSMPPREKSRDSSLPPRTKSLDEQMQSSSRNAESSRHTRSRKLDPEGKELTVSQRKQVSRSARKMLSADGIDKSSSRLSHRLRRRRSSITPPKSTSNDTKDVSSGGDAKSSTADKEATIAGDAEVEPMQLVVDSSGTQLICENTKFSSTHTSTPRTPKTPRTPRSAPTNRKPRRNTASCHMPTIKTSASGSRRTPPQTTRMRTAVAAQRLSQSNSRKQERLKRKAATPAAPALTPQQLLHESCVF